MYHLLGYHFSWLAVSLGQPELSWINDSQSLSLVEPCTPSLKLLLRWGRNSFYSRRASSNDVVHNWRPGPLQEVGASSQDSQKFACKSCKPRVCKLLVLGVEAAAFSHGPRESCCHIQLRLWHFRHHQSVSATLQERNLDMCLCFFAVPQLVCIWRTHAVYSKVCRSDKVQRPAARGADRHFKRGQTTVHWPVVVKYTRLWMRLSPGSDQPAKPNVSPNREQPSSSQGQAVLLAASMRLVRSPPGPSTALREAPTALQERTPS